MAEKKKDQVVKKTPKATKNVKNTKVESKSAQKPTAKSAPKPKEQIEIKEVREEKYVPSIASQIMPYVLMIFSVVLAIAFITVRLLEIDDGAGVIGYALQWIFCGLLGSAVGALIFLVL